MAGNDLIRRFAEALAGDWRTVARPEQIDPPGDWTTWIFCGGRGAGKTRSGAEWVQERAVSGVAKRIHLIAPTAADVRQVMLEGPAGLLTIAAPNVRPVYSPALRKLEWPNGAVGLLFSGDEPERLRGPQCDTLWIDELCAMRMAQDIIDMAFLGLRVGKDPRCLITTTPRPIKVFKDLLARDGQDVVVTRSSTTANAANLAKPFLDQIVAKYAGTRLGRQEIDAELLTDTPGALWHLERIEELRVRQAPPLERVVVAIDPAVTFGPDSDETGIVVVGRAGDGQAYVLDDLSGRYPPLEWAQRAILAYRQHCADRIIGEVNNGGALIESTLRSVDAGIPFSAVHASRGKLVRAEPVSALYEQGRVHHVGLFGPLEDQMTSYDGNRTDASPDRLDALCWGLTELMLGEPPGGFFKEAALLVKPANTEAPAPIEVPSRITGVFAAIAGSVGPEPGTIGTVHFGLQAHDDRGPPHLIVLDWDLQDVQAETLHAIVPALLLRQAQLMAECRTLSRHVLMVLEASGIGETLLDLTLRAGLVDSDLMITHESEHGAIADRIVKASGHVAAGRVLLSRPAHEKLLAYKGVTRNHLLAQVTAFGLSQEKSAAGELLVAFANGVVRTFVDNMRSKR